MPAMSDHYVIRRVSLCIANQLFRRMPNGDMAGDRQWSSGKFLLYGRQQAGEVSPRLFDNSLAFDFRSKVGRSRHREHMKFAFESPGEFHGEFQRAFRDGEPS
jgi:hypothetical protein